MTCGIYKIKNKKTGQIYIGQSKNIELRFKTHCSVSPIDIAIATEGVDNFEFSIIEETTSLHEQEQFWIRVYDTYNNEYHYNCSPGKGMINNLQYGYGYNNARAKYTLWDINYAGYDKNRMYRRNRKINPCSCFSAKYEGYVIPIGRFYDFVTCEIINRLIKEAIK